MNILTKKSHGLMHSAYFNTQIIPQGKNKLAKTHLTRLYELLNTTY